MTEKKTAANVHKFHAEEPAKQPSLDIDAAIQSTTTVQPSPAQLAEKLLSQIEQRIHINTVQQILREIELISARSWQELKGIIKTGVNQKPELAEKLKAAMEMQQLCDLKAVSFFSLPTEIAETFLQKIAEFNIESSPLASAYPFEATEEELRDDDKKLKVVSKFSDSHGAGLVLSRRREFSVSNEISRESFTDELAASFPEAEKIIEVKTISRQMFDVIYVNRQFSVLEIRADMTREDGQLQTSKQLDVGLRDLSTMASMLSSTWRQGFNLGKPLNLYPLTKMVYDDMSGAIKRIGFATRTDSIKKETMKAGVDLRKEAFHMNGAEAIDHEMDIFEIAIQWSQDSGKSRPELHIPGNYRDYMKPNARADHVLIKGIRNHEDSNFILNKVEAYRAP